MVEFFSVKNNDNERTSYHNIILYENVLRCEVVVLPDDMKNDA